MKNISIEELGKKLDALDLWDSVMPYNWVVKPSGIVFPYFCTLLKGDGKIVKVRFLMLEGWQTFHDYIRTRIDRNFGYYLTPMEMPHFELVVSVSGEVAIFRHDPGYMPRALDERERALLLKILWEAYGVIMRVETDKKLPLQFASEKSMFARVEDSSGKWSDAPMSIPEPRPFVEEVSFPKILISKAKDLPQDQSMSVAVDFRLLSNMMTKEQRPRCAYQLIVVDLATGVRILQDKVSVSPDGGLKAMWQAMPSRVLTSFIEYGRIPGVVKVMSGRVFRLLRSLCLELPIKLSLHDSIKALEDDLKV